MAYKQASKDDLTALAGQMVEPIIKEIRDEHQLLVAQQRQFAVSLKELHARQDLLAATLKDLEQKTRERLSLVLMRMGELENR